MRRIVSVSAAFQGGRECYVASLRLDEVFDGDFGMWEPTLSLRIFCFLGQGQRGEQGCVPVAFYCDGGSAEQR